MELCSLFEKGENRPVDRTETTSIDFAFFFIILLALKSSGTLYEELWAASFLSWPFYYLHSAAAAAPADFFFLSFPTPLRLCT